MNGRCENVSRIDGHTDCKEITDCFRNTFHKVYASSNTESDNKLRYHFYTEYQAYLDVRGSDSLTQFYFSWEEMLAALGKIKSGKASRGFVKSQHVFLGSPKLAVHLNILFNGIVQHSFVPQEFLNGTIMIRMFYLP